jgi:predicted NUDIX family NTP pyrophosphohydrolase
MARPGPGHGVRPTRAIAYRPSGQNHSMAAKRSAGLLLFRRTSGGVEVLLGHSGGPYFERRDVGAWSVPKGEYGDDETAFDAARREFTEELGLPVPDGEPLPLGEIVQRSGKIVTVWAVEADLDPDSITPGTFLMEWPPKSGRHEEFPEIDRVAWFGLDDARARMIQGQQPLLDRLP